MNLMVLPEVWANASGASIKAANAAAMATPEKPRRILIIATSPARSRLPGYFVQFRCRAPYARTGLVTQRSDGVQQLHTVPNRGDAKLLQGLVRQARENRLVYVILAEDRLVLPEAQAPQADH